ncbi:hypothetical protein ACFOU0_02965 [Salinicoccus sesuvii]|uniref:5,10-methylene-tetrahydrofolate dehydrogenase n=1 Tax=Salinicoccus sesuvii TaxID=868281 RepID=A0ABV7N4L7_9STAP
MTKKIVGLITPPGYLKKLSESLKQRLPDMLSYNVSDEFEWQLEYNEDILTGGTNEPHRVIEEAVSKKESQDWDYAIALTDLPLFRDNLPIVAEVVCDDSVGLVSLPGLGLVPMGERVCEATVQLISEIYFGTSDDSREQAQNYVDSQGEENYKVLKNNNSKQLFNKRFFEILSPLKRQVVEYDENEDSTSEIDLRYTVKSRLNGLLRIVSGMVYANRPWEIFPAYYKIIVVAFTTGAYALIFPSIAQLSEIYSTTRLTLLTLIAISILIAWIILAHGLWQRKPDEEDDKESYLRKLYNITTIFTLLITVVMYYVILFFMFLFTTSILLPAEKLQGDLTGSGEINALNYIIMAWTVTTFATIIGAIGSVFEDKEVILNSTYGYRQRQRYEKAEEQMEEDKQKKEEEQEGTEKRTED